MPNQANQPSTHTIPSTYSAPFFQSKDQFIPKFLENICKDFSNDILTLPSLCNLKKLRFDNPNEQPDYSDITIQRLYLLRYAYAYFSEYYYLYDCLFKKYQNNQVKILSIGTGCNIDYYAAYFASIINYVNLDHFGIDIIDWKDKQNLDNYNNFILSDIAKVDLSQFIDTDIIIFPKSLCELPEKTVKAFFKNIQKQSFKCNSIYLISSQRSCYLNQDSTRFNQLVQSFEQIGFTKKKGKIVTAPQNYTSFYHIVNFSYPDHICILLESLAQYCKNINNCPNGKGRGICDTGNQLNRSPMLSPRLMKIEFALVCK